jgi:hypothetical protein
MIRKQPILFLIIVKNGFRKRGMEAMDGPINFGERDKFWGLLIEGFIEPLFGMNYNFLIIKIF